MFWLAGQINVTGSSYKLTQQRAFTTHALQAICPGLLPTVESATVYTSDSVYSVRPPYLFTMASKHFPTFCDLTTCRLVPLVSQRQTISFEEQFGRHACIDQPRLQRVQLLFNCHTTNKLARNRLLSNGDSWWSRFLKSISLTDLKNLNENRPWWWAMMLPWQQAGWACSLALVSSGVRRAACGVRHPDGLGF